MYDGSTDVLFLPACPLCIHIYIYRSMHTRIHTCICMHIHVHIYMYVYIYIYTSVYKYMCLSFLLCLLFSGSLCPCLSPTPACGPA